MRKKNSNAFSIPSKWKHFQLPEAPSGSQCATSIWRRRPSNCHMRRCIENSSQLSNREYSKMLSTKNIKENILAIEYPGIVKNIDYALDTLGGLTNISKVVRSHSVWTIIAYQNLNTKFSLTRRAVQKRNAWHWTFVPRIYSQNRYSAMSNRPLVCSWKFDAERRKQKRKMWRMRSPKLRFLVLSNR